MTDAEWQKTQQFAAEFKALVRKYMPKSPVTANEGDMLAFMQDKTSCYSPYVWSDD